MAKKPTKTSGDAAHSGKLSLDQVTRRINQEHGVGTVVTGRELVIDPPRLPTGVFAVDYATGGGLPIWGSTCFWGPDSGGKTTLGINAMVMAGQICWRCFNLISECSCSGNALRMKSSWIDIEGTFDRDWATKVGADPDSYILALAESGEQYINIATQVIKAEDCGLVVIDSLAALAPSSELEAAAEDQFIGLQARMITRMVRNLKQRLIRERKLGHPCAILFVNQMRTKIGQLYGDPETMPGGYGMKHEFSLLLRLVKKSLRKDGPDRKYFDAKRSKNQAERFSFSVKKAKVQTLAGVGEFVRVVEKMPELDLSPGMVDDYATLLSYCKTYNIITKDPKGGWRYFNFKANTLDQIREVWMRNPAQKVKAQKSVIEHAKIQFSTQGGRDTGSDEEED